ncbi:MAG: DUF483 domain-containing protein [Nanoarchaeota archaeon]|nr:DUF483 domain-containing protein [Nanoarchaeota archaeon]MBU1622728.1 DUF483 domain-containing protein [Nanoarchaeota archaeon]MBU1973834.1 DUF483 domain-containing protein [Nanoarchaeota archaeon]
MIDKLSLIFGSKTKAQEIVLLLNDAKPVVRQGFYPEELPKVERFCKNNYLFIAKSRFKVIMVDNGSYSNKGLRIPEMDKRPGMYFVYLSKDEEKTWLAAYQEMMHSDRELGILLGYPVCCVDYFCHSFSKSNVDPMHKPTNPYTNLTKRDQDCVLLSHFPCSSDCDHSLQLARKYLNVLADVDRNRARKIMEKLR